MKMQYSYSICTLTSQSQQALSKRAIIYFIKAANRGHKSNITPGALVEKFAKPRPGLYNPDLTVTHFQLLMLVRMY